mgnify:CR=1 FL=1
MGVNHDPLAGAPRLDRERGTCVVCGLPLPAPEGRGRPRVTHPACSAAWKRSRDDRSRLRWRPGDAARRTPGPLPEGTHAVTRDVEDQDQGDDAPELDRPAPTGGPVFPWEGDADEEWAFVPLTLHLGPRHPANGGPG